jgi:hypothetical protein
MPDSSWLSNAHECLWEGVTCSPPYIPHSPATGTLPMPSNNTSNNTDATTTIPGAMAIANPGDLLTTSSTRTSTFGAININSAVDTKTGRERKHDEVVMEAEKEYRRDRDRHDRRQMLRSRRSLSTSTAKVITDTDVVEAKYALELELALDFIVNDAFVEGQATAGHEDHKGTNVHEARRVVGLDLHDRGLTGAIPLDLKLLGASKIIS